MRRQSAVCVFLALLGLVTPAAAQAPLTLAEAIARARARNPDAGSSAAAEREAAERVAQARAGYWPRVDVAESWQRGNQPVFVFGVLLAQGRFEAQNFALAALNHPDAVDNFRSAVSVEQTLFDGTTRAQVTAAGIGHEMAAASRLLVDHDLAMAVTEAYGRVLVASSARRSADAAAETARADRELAANRRDAEVVTDADVLQLDVHVSRTREQQIRAMSDERVARGRLNQVMGEPLGEISLLESAAAAAVIDISDLAALEAEAIGKRPDIAIAALQERLAQANRRRLGRRSSRRCRRRVAGNSTAASGTAAQSSWGVGRRRADQRVPRIRRQGASWRSREQVDAARPRTRKGGHRRAARRVRGRREAGAARASAAVGPAPWRRRARANGSSAIGMRRAWPTSCRCCGRRRRWCKPRRSSPPRRWRS